MKILMSGRLTFIAFVFLFWDARFQVSVFSAAAGLKSGQFDRRRNFKKANIES
jgi:hypothetical protein